jgi:alkanesulfonate monooxygenase
VHFIAGGSDVEQAKEGDFLNKEERYERLEEVNILSSFSVKFCTFQNMIPWVVRYKLFKTLEIESDFYVISFLLRILTRHSLQYIKILRRAWKSPAPFDWEGKHYQFKQFSNYVRPHGGKETIPVSVGGSSEAAYRIGGSLADIFGLWGEPLKETKEQIDKIYAEAEKAGRARRDYPRIWVTFRPIVAETDDLAWAKAHR